MGRVLAGGSSCHLLPRRSSSSCFLIQEAKFGGERDRKGRKFIAVRRDVLRTRKVKA